VPEKVRSILVDTFVGRRGIVKANPIWLSLAVIQAFGDRLTVRPGWRGCLFVYAVSVCLSQGAILVNDFVDAEADRRSGKERWIARLSRPCATVVIAALFITGLALLLAADAPHPAWAAYFVASALACAYSVPPVRAKTRGLWGPLVYALATMGAFALLPFGWFWLTLPTFLLIAVAVILDKWVNLHFHQVLDHASDSANGVETYTGTIGLERSRCALRRIARLAGLWLLATAAWLLLRLPRGALLVGAVTGAVVVAAAGHVLAGRRGGGAGPLVAELPALYLGATYGVFRVMPPLILGTAATTDRSLWAIAGLCGALMCVESWHFLNYRHG